MYTDINLFPLSVWHNQLRRLIQHLHDMYTDINVFALSVWHNQLQTFDKQHIRRINAHTLILDLASLPRIHVTLPSEMSRIATCSLFGYSHFPERDAMYRFWLYNEISFFSLFYNKNTLVTHTHSLSVSFVSV